MWILCLLLGSICISAITAASNIEECTNQLDLPRLKEAIESSVEDEWKVVCPPMIGHLKCVEEVAEAHLGGKLAELQLSLPSDSNAAKGVTILLNVKSLLHDLCTEGTHLHQAYSEHATCYGSLVADYNNECLTAASLAYKRFEDSVQEEAGENTSSDVRDCIFEAYKSACVAAMIYDHCGQRAFNIYQQMIKRTGIFKLAICSEKSLQTLQTKFADSLDLEEERKNLFRLAFDLKKRRK